MPTKKKRRFSPKRYKCPPPDVIAARLRIAGFTHDMGTSGQRAAQAIAASGYQITWNDPSSVRLAVVGLISDLMDAAHLRGVLSMPMLIEAADRHGIRYLFGATDEECGL